MKHDIESHEDTAPADRQDWSPDEPSAEAYPAEPGVDEPDLAEPGVNEPGVDERGLDEPRVDEPGVDEPGLDEPRVDEPGLVDPQATQVVDPDHAHQHGDAAAAAPAVARAPVDPVPGDGYGQDRGPADRDPGDRHAEDRQVGDRQVEDRAPMWSDGHASDLEDRWREVLLRFVEDPRTAADEAQRLTSEALDRFTASLQDRKQELDGWQQADHTDTEQLRTAVRQYRQLLDRLLAV